MIEGRAKRLKRFQMGPPEEIIETLLNSIDNFYNRQIDQAAAEELWLLVILGIHSVALTITEGVFGKSGLTGFKFFLENFMDKDEEGFDFSAISSEMHNWRNIIAHQWLSASGYDFGTDLQMDKGWEVREGITYFNPKVYYQAFENSFGRGGRIWNIDKMLTEKEAQEAKSRLLEKYQKR